MLGTQCTYAQWSKNEVFTYDFGSAKASFDYTEGTSNISSSFGKSKGFLPLVKGITSRVLISKVASNGRVILDGSHSLIIQQPQKGIVKYSGYDIKLATDLACMSFELKFNKISPSGDYVWAIGAKSAGLFTGIGTVYRSNSEIFTALKWVAKDNKYLLQNRVGSDESTVTSWKTIPSISFHEGEQYQFEIYCNNTGKEQKYTRDNHNYTLGINQYAVWINNVLIADHLEKSIEVSGSDGLTNGKSISLESKEALNAFLFVTNGRPNADGSMSISNIKLVYSKD